MQRVFIILTFFLVGCGTASNITTSNPIGEQNKDVLILITLVQERLRQSDERELDLNELLQHDTLKRISHNFEKAELKSLGTYISVHYKFSASRNAHVELTSKERKLLNDIRWTTKASTGQYDGEIRFDFGERLYRIKKIIVSK